MADKEERIEISTYDLNNKEWNGDIPIDIHKVYTRTEAIEVMAKALCLCDDDGGCKGKCDNKCQVWEYSIPAAEAALNALLEGGNNGK